MSQTLNCNQKNTQYKLDQISLVVVGRCTLVAVNNVAITTVRSSYSICINLLPHSYGFASIYVVIFVWFST